VAVTAVADPTSSSRKITLSDSALDEHRIIARMGRDPNADIFRILRTKVLHLLTHNNFRSIAVTSANYGEGKTTIATNLALSLALDVKQTVCLVDLDFRRPNLHACHGLSPDVGLGDYLLANTAVADCMIRPADRLVVLPTSRALENSSETLASPKMMALANELKTRYPDRIIIYDMPPLLAQDDTIAFLPNVDGVILVVQDGVSQVDDLRQCLHYLEGHTLIGTVLNKSYERSFNRKNP
jgi:Mrp family chromosome partitioning ATPase